MTPTDEQAHILSLVANTSDNLMINSSFVSLKVETTSRIIIKV